LFIEPAGLELWQVGDIEVWRDVARWLARWHFRMTSEPSVAAVRPTLLDYDRSWYLRWAGRAAAFNPELASITELYDVVSDRLADLPNGFIHGEFCASNVLVELRRNAAPVVRPVDWEMAGWGPLLMDLAALVAGWDECKATDIATAYAVEWCSHDSGQATDEVLAALDWCRLHHCIQWAGWAPRWTPPSEHMNDWGAEALRLAEKVGLCKIAV
jgi:Ser/Thr protein kinase RdoA (MazF antagonist)